MSGTFNVTTKTAPAQVLAYFTEAEGLSDLTPQIEISTIASQEPMRGGLADVYAATLADGTKVAVKSLRAKTNGDNKELKRTARELSAWAKLRHDNILNLLGLAYYGRRLSMVSPWMENGTVVQYVRQNPEINRYHLCAELASGMAYLHEMNVVHGDIKGENVLVTIDGHIKLTDFGLTITYHDTLRFSTTDTFGGTMRWMAPELMSGKKSRCLTTDVWALGMTMLEIITGEMPFSEIRLMANLKKEVIENAKTPNRPNEILERSEHGSILWRKLLECWVYQAEARITAKEMLHFFEVIMPSDAAVLDFNHDTSLDEVISYLTKTWSLRDWTIGLNPSSVPFTGGGLGDVYKGSIANRTKVAIKSMRISSDSRGLERAARELHTWSKLRHINVLEFFGVAKMRDQLVMISPWMDNGTVPQFLEKYPDIDRYIFCEQLANVVAYLHDIDVVHGDLKGANLLVSPDGALKLTDFGTSMTREDIMYFPEIDEEPLITVRYTAPEILKGKSHHSPEGDVWALGMTMLEIVTGNLPYHALKSDHAVISAIVVKEQLPEPIEDFSPRAQMFSMFLVRCWEFDPQSRATATQVQTMISILKTF